MRLIVISVLALLGFSLIAVLVTNREPILTRMGLNPKSGDRIYYALETGEAEFQGHARGAAGSVDLKIRQYRDWLAIAGFSSNQTFALPLLRDTAYSAGLVSVDLRADLDQDTTGRLRLRVNGRERGEIVLARGSRKYRVDVPLGPLELNRDWVEIELDARGNNPKAVCTDDWDGGVVITVEPSTKVSLALEEEISSDIDRILASGSPASVVWNNPTVDAAPEDAEAFHASVPWSWPPSVVDVLFFEPDSAPEGAVNVDLEVLLDTRKQLIERQLTELQLSARNDLSWPIELFQSDPLAQLREFRNRGTWAFSYEAADLPNGQLPDQLNLDLQFATTVPNQQWLYLVTLNGVIVHSERITGSADIISRAISLPLEIQHLDNTVRISLTSDEAKEGPCVQGAPAAAQIVAGSNLTRNASQIRPVFDGMLRVVVDDMDLYVAPSVNAIEANQAFYTIGQIFRATRVVSLVRDRAQGASPGHGVIAVLDTDYLAEAVDRIGKNLPSMWFAFTVFDEDLEPRLEAFRGNSPQFQKAVELFEPDSLIAIAPPGLW